MTTVAVPLTGSTTPAGTMTTTTVLDSIVRVTILATDDAEIGGVTGATIVSQPTDPLTEPWVVDIDRSETLTIDAGYDNWAPTDGATCTFGGSNLLCEFSAVTGNTVTVTLSWQPR